jgi:hypothetical protein
MNWFFTVVRVAGASFPGASSLVQLQSELTSNELAERIRKFEDPISFLHEDVPELSKHLYAELRNRNRTKLEFDDEFYTRFSRPIAALDAKSLIESQHALGRHLPVGIILSDPSYVMYLCALSESSKKMEALVKRVDECKIGEWLDGRKIAEEIELPLPVVADCFQIYESKGYGICSHETGAVNYCGYA